MSSGLTVAQIQMLSAMTDLVTAGRALGIGRTKAYQLARAGQFPCRVLRVGHSYRVATADLLAVLGIPAHLAVAPADQPSQDGQPTHREES